MKIERLENYAVLRPDGGFSRRKVNFVEDFDDRITDQQKVFLTNSYFQLEEKDKVAKKYRGCGCGWIEIDPSGEVVDLKYIDGDKVKVRSPEDDDDPEGAVLVVSDEEEAKRILREAGTEEGNWFTVPFWQSFIKKPLILENGNIRIFVNMSSFGLYRY